jgi:DNA-binding transcriptional LysR family regulator
MDDYVRFLAVANEQSISRAGELLHVSQPAMSRTIALLEARFGTSLFRRTATGVELTEAGTVLYEYANRAVRAIDNAVSTIRHAEARGRLVLSLAAGDGWGYGILPPIIRQFCRDNPQVSVRLETIELDMRIQGLKNGNFDLAFGILFPELRYAQTFEFVPLMEAKFDVYCHAGHPLATIARERPIRDSDLLAHPWINYKFKFDYDWIRNLGTNREFEINTNNLLSTIEIMQESNYLTSAAKSFHGFFERNNIVSIGEDPESPLFRSGAVYVERRSLRPIAKKFLSYVVSHCNKLRPRKS